MKPYPTSCEHDDFLQVWTFDAASALTLFGLKPQLHDVIELKAGPTTPREIAKYHPNAKPWKISNAVACAMNFDDPGMRKEFNLGEAQVKNLKTGYRITATLEELKRLAYHMTRESGWDLPPSTIYACNQAAKKLSKFIAEQTAGKDLT